VVISALIAATLGFSSATAVATGTGGTYTPLTSPYRAGTDVVAAGETVSFQVAGAGGVPNTGVSAVAVTLSATSTDTTSSSALTAFPATESRPTLSTLAYTKDNAPRSSTAIVKLGTDGKVSVYNKLGSTRVYLDVQGYFSTASDGTSTGGFVAITPARIARSDTGDGMSAGTVGVGSYRDIQVTGVADIPGTATGIYANIIATDGTAPGAINAGPGGADLTNKPATLRYGDNGVYSGAAAIKLSNNGMMRIHNSVGSSINVRVDIQGYFSGSPSEGGSFTPLTQALTYSTSSSGQTALAGGQTRTIEVGGKSGLPADDSLGAVSLMVTTRNWSSGGSVTVWNPELGTKPIPPTSNFVGTTGTPSNGLTTSTIVEVSGEGTLNLTNTSANPVSVELSTNGWFSSTLVSEDDGQTGEIGDPAQWSAAQYADEKGISQAAAAAVLADQLNIQQKIDSIEAAIPAEKDGGYSITSTSTGAELSVRLTPDASAQEVANIQGAADSAGVDVLITKSASSTLASRRAVIASHVDSWKAAIPSIDGIYADEASDKVVLLVTDESAAEAARNEPVRVRKAQAASQESTGQNFDDGGLDVEIEEAAPSANSNKGGRNMTTCTSGFPAIAGKTKVILTAAHCEEEDYFWFNGNGPFTAKFIGERYDDEADIEWLRPTKHKVEARYFEEATKSGEGTRVKGNLKNVKGAYVCHRGKTTGTSCGTIVSTTHRPMYDGACKSNGRGSASVKCDDKFVFVKGPNLRNDEGDSGGPWFLYGYGYGIHKGGARDGSSSIYSKLGNLPSHVKIYKFS
jgi:hypothetical protein